MKKILFTLISVALISSFSSAQMIKKGIKGGINFSSIGNFDNLTAIEEASSLTSWHAGVFLGVKAAIVTVQADILYSVQGSNYNDISGEEHKLENSYVNIPVVVKVSLVPVLNLQAGVQYGILVSSKLDGDKDYQIGATIEEDYFTGGDWAIPVGIGLDVSKLMIDLRYIIGVADINNVSLTETKLSNGVFQASVGIKF